MSNRSIYEEARSRTRSEVVAWRETRLRLAGFDQDDAARLACEETVDFHVLLDLMDRGCPPQLAARILAPLNDEGSPVDDDRC